MARSGITDPLRNFKFLVQFIHPTYSNELAQMGFMSVSGLAVSTEAIPYREGGMNTSPHKFPGQSDFAPITFVNGTFRDKYAMWYVQRQLYFYQQGGGTLDFAGSGAGDFRCDIIIRLLRHPVTRGAEAAGYLYSGVEWAVKLYNAWPTSLAYSDLNAGDNSVLVQQATFVHEGFDIKWGDGAATPFQ